MRERYKLAGSDPTFRPGTAGRSCAGSCWTTSWGPASSSPPATSRLARSNGIPARLVVGSVHPAKPDADGWYTVRNADALAWPEVAVDGVGWWPLDPAGQAQAEQAGGTGSSDSELTEQARAEVPPLERDRGPRAAIDDPGAEATGAGQVCRRYPRAWIFVAPVALLLLWLVGVPLLKWARAARRRRRTGSAAVVGAWAEARDRLRAHGVAVTAGMTVRDLVRPLRARWRTSRCAGD